MNEQPGLNHGQKRIGIGIKILLRKMDKNNFIMRKISLGCIENEFQELQYL